MVRVNISVQHIFRHQGYTVFMSNVSAYPVYIKNRKRRQAPSCEELSTLKNMTSFAPIGNTTSHFYQVKQLPAQKTFLFRVTTRAYKGHYGEMSAVACVVTLGGRSFSAVQLLSV